MALRQLKARPVPKIWGRDVLPPPFERFAGGSRIGELRFEDEDCPAPSLSVKYLFTRQKMSVQVHPRGEGAGRGGDEAWVVVSAARGAAVGLGTREPLDRRRLAEAARDGSIEALLDWRPAEAGSAFYSPAGTVHSLGGDLVVLEIREDPAVTYRLYDFDRPRPLHLEQALDAVVPGNGSSVPPPCRLDALRELLVASDRFVVERWTGPGSHRLTAEPGQRFWIVALAGGCRADDVELEAGTTWVLDGSSHLRLSEESLLIVASPRPSD
ncbi:MAG: mannose-6-phosphate isomerase [Sphingomonadales bacterium]|jgi:mannose-6-phosphate isomerase|nr:mannose-6-phosphate isomerase [Sphingomonadales bacterium]